MSGYITNDPFTLQSQVKRAYLLRRKGLITDKEFADVVAESLHKTTNFTDDELLEDDRKTKPMSGADNRVSVTDGRKAIEELHRAIKAIEAEDCYTKDSMPEKCFENLHYAGVHVIDAYNDGKLQVHWRSNQDEPIRQARLAIDRALGQGHLIQLTGTQLDDAAVAVITRLNLHWTRHV